MIAQIPRRTHKLTITTSMDERQVVAFFQEHSMTVKAAAKRLGLRVEVIERLIDRGYMDYFQVGRPAFYHKVVKTHVRIPIAEVDGLQETLARGSLPSYLEAVVNQ